MGILHNSFSKCFFFSLNAFHKERDKAAAGGQKTSENFTAMFCFLQALSSAKAQKKSQQTGIETAALSFFVWIFSLCLHD